MTLWLCINLDERPDRLMQITKHFEDLGIYFIRFPAIKHSLGALGCMMSHLNCLEIAKQSDIPYAVVVEDDCEFLIKGDEVEYYIGEFLKTNSPIMVFGGTRIQRSPYNSLFSRGKNIQTSTCYIVKREYYDILIKLWRQSLIEYESTLDPNATLDAVWKKLQKKDVWLVPQKKIVQQRPGFSNIINIYVDYRENFK